MLPKHISREKILRNCPPELVYQVVTDYAAYPRLFAEFKEALIRERIGSRLRVEFVVQIVLKTHVVVDVNHDSAALSTRWTFVGSDIVKQCEGGWKVIASGDDSRLRFTSHMSVAGMIPSLMVNKISRFKACRTPVVIKIPVLTISPMRRKQPLS